MSSGGRPGWWAHKLVIDPVLHARLLQLCTRGFLERKILGDGESSFLDLLSNLGITYTRSDQDLEIETALELLNLKSIRTPLSENPLFDSFEWQYQMVTESTNADALQFFETSRQPCIVLSEMQTGGRGRRGRAWISPFGKNIYCTIGIPKSIEGYNPGLLSIVTGIALCKALASCGINDVGLKWPNDLYYQNQKLGGILIESKMSGTAECFFAIGFGINVSMEERDFGVIPQPATSVNLINGSPLSRDIIISEVTSQVVTMIDNFDQSTVSQVVEAFDVVDVFRNQPISVTTATETIEGVNSGINSSGQLLLDTDAGQLQFSAADISLRGRA
jgi:BirA family biotin operon repressor/biotin-[acetyl-CoA-carboxylase] ligase